jgi:hypothetical protein
MRIHRSKCASSEAAAPRLDWLERLAAAYNRAIDRYEDLGRRAPLPFAILTVALAFTIVFLVFSPGFDTNDDAVMNMIVAGKGYGLAPDEHMVFTNVLLGFVLKGLYSLWPSFPWYGGYLLAVHFAAQTITLYCVIRPGYTRLRLRLYLVYFAAAGLYLINNLQFTSTAFLAGQSGVLLLMLAIGRAEQADARRWPWLWCGISFLCLLLASLIRREVFYPVVGLAIPTCGLVALAGRRPVRNSLAVVGVTAAAFAAATICWKFNYAYYESDPGWSGFYEYNKLRVKFNDEAWVRYSPETAHLFQEVNWSENDFEMLSAWFFDNQRLYNASALERVLALYPWQQSRVSAEMFAGELATVLLDAGSLALLLALPLLIFCVERRAATLAVVGLALAASVGLIMYLILFSKTPPSRVYVPVLAFPLSVAACLAHGASFLPPERFRTWMRVLFSQPAGWRRAFRIPLTKYVAVAVLLLLCVAVFKSTYHQYRRSRERIKASAQLYDLLAQIEPADDKLFICWAASFPYEALRPFATFKSMDDLRLLVVGWPQTTPFHQRMKEHFGISDLAEAMFRRNDLYLIAHPYYLGLYEKYVGEHFGVRLVYETRRFAKLFAVTQALDRSQSDSGEVRLAKPLKPSRTN